MTITFDPWGVAIYGWLLFLCAMNLAGWFFVVRDLTRAGQLQLLIDQLTKLVMANNRDRAIKLCNGAESLKVAPILKLLLVSWVRDPRSGFASKAQPDDQSLADFKRDSLVDLVDAAMTQDTLKLPAGFALLSFVTSCIVLAAMWLWYPSTMVLVLGGANIASAKMVSWFVVAQRQTARIEARAAVLKFYVFLRERQSA